MEMTAEKNPFVEEQREWLIAHREETGKSWSRLAEDTGIPQGTISQFGSDKGYNGKKNEQALAEKVERFRRSLTQQASLDAEAPDIPSWFATETTDRLERMLGFSQTGQMVAAALEAGCSKSTTAKHYADMFPNVYYLDVPRSAGAPNNLLKLILETLGIRDASGGTYDMSREVRDQLKRATNPLLIIDEAQHLSETSLEEVRYWHDKINVGIALFGNVGLLQQLSKHAQLYSRIQLKWQQRVPTPADVYAMADAWAISCPAIRAELQVICGKLGGLRNGTNALKLASIIATAQDQQINIDHLRIAWRDLDFRMVAA